MTRKIKLTILILLTVGFFNSCKFVSNYFKYRDTTKELMNDILKKDYNNAVKLFALQHPNFLGTDTAAFKSKLPAFRDIIVNNFGDNLNYSMMTASKKWSSNEKENNQPNTTTILMQISNSKEFGVLQVLFDDKSKKVLTIKTLDVKDTIPNMTPFWLFGILAICISIFNIYMIVKIKRSKFKKKWLKYLAIIFLNVPAITYKAVGGLSLGLSFQILLGISFEFPGYLTSFWTFGIPLGGLYIFWKLQKQKDDTITIEINKSDTTQMK